MGCQPFISGQHDGALKLTGVKCCLGPSSLRLVSGSLEQEGGRDQKGKGRWKALNARLGELVTKHKPLYSICK